jgi:hypothetical protein
MPEVKSPAALKSAYEATLQRVQRGDLPTSFLYGGQTLFRSINPKSAYTPLPQPGPGGTVSLAATTPLLKPGDVGREGHNRFSGPSYNNPAITAIGGLYCVMQQQALVNESAHYSGKAHAWALSQRCVLRVRINGTVTVADLSPHNPGSSRFLRSLGKNVWEKMNDPDDCSVARGIGLALATLGFVRGILVQTVRASNRSEEELGDNVVFFSTGNPVPGIAVDQVYFFGKTAAPEVFAVTRP